MSNPERFIGIKNSNKLVVWALVWERVWACVWAQIWALVRVQVWMWAQLILHIYIHDPINKLKTLKENSSSLGNER